MISSQEIKEQYNSSFKQRKHKNLDLDSWRNDCWNLTKLFFLLLWVIAQNLKPAAKIVSMYQQLQITEHKKLVFFKLLLFCKTHLCQTNASDNAMS